jgi:hypothetical protein
MTSAFDTPLQNFAIADTRLEKHCWYVEED